jgi:hypothetical protein
LERLGPITEGRVNKTLACRERHERRKHRGRKDHCLWIAIKRRSSTRASRAEKRNHSVVAALRWVAYEYR